MEIPPLKILCVGGPRAGEIVERPFTPSARGNETPEGYRYTKAATVGKTPWGYWRFMVRFFVHRSIRAKSNAHARALLCLAARQAPTVATLNTSTDWTSQPVETEDDRLTFEQLVTRGVSRLVRPADLHADHLRIIREAMPKVSSVEAHAQAVRVMAAAREQAEREALHGPPGMPTPRGVLSIYAPSAHGKTEETIPPVRLWPAPAPRATDPDTCVHRVPLAAPCPQCEALERARPQKAPPLCLHGIPMDRRCPECAKVMRPSDDPGNPRKG